MSDSAKALNWSIVVYIVIYAFGYSKIVVAEPDLRILFVLVPICLLIWQVLILRHRFVQLRETADVPFYERIDTGDWWRVFFILWSGHNPFASDYAWGFFLFSVIVAVLVGLLVFTVSIEFYRKRTATPLLIGCLAFGYFLLSWERDTYVIHYGVPIIGHFFEKPEYDARYRVEIELENSNRQLEAIADIHVENRTETDWYDYNEGSTYTYIERYINFRKLYFPNGGTAVIDYQDLLLAGSSPLSGRYVLSAHGRSWYVRLLEPIR